MMISLPTPPTDNLYKFVAISGVVLFLTGFGLRWLLDKQEIEWYEQAMKATRAQIEENNAHYWGTMMDRARNNDEEMVNKFNMMQRLMEQARSKEMERLYNQILARNMMKEGRDKALWIASWIGAVIAPLGFFAWWLRVQRPLDEILRLQLEKTRTELTAPTTPYGSG